MLPYTTHAWSSIRVKLGLLFLFCCRFPHSLSIANGGHSVNFIYEFGLLYPNILETIQLVQQAAQDMRISGFEDKTVPVTIFALGTKHVLDGQPAAFEETMILRHEHFCVENVVLFVVDESQSMLCGVAGTVQIGNVHVFHVSKSPVIPLPWRWHRHDFFENTAWQ